MQHLGYVFGQDESVLDRYGWIKENGAHQAHLPRTLRPNLAGLFDLNGNVAEWCHDWVGSYGSTSDPLGSAAGLCRVFCGGSWNGEAANCQTAGRGTNEPTSLLGNIGFGLALSPSMKSEESRETHYWLRLLSERSLRDNMHTEYGLIV